MAAQAREQGHEALMAARKVQQEQDERLNKIQVELAALRSKEKQIAEVSLGERETDSGGESGGKRNR